jgi:hypothetical protein
MRHLNYENEKVISLDTYINDLQKDIDDLEWSGKFKRADLLKRWLDEAKLMRDKGEVWYPLF